jgi:hypothetical protein
VVVDVVRIPALPITRVIPDGPISSFFRDVRSFLQQLLTAAPQLWGNRISVAFPGAGTAAVVHGLGRVPQGYTVEGLSAAITVSDGTPGPLPATTHLYLASTGAGTARLLVF